MSLPSAILLRTDPAVAAAKKKRVLLVDSSRVKRDLRSETMRKLGMDVDCAADISEARCWWRPDLYDLVLLHIPDARGAVEKFCNDLHSATPPQQVMFLVGRPAYLSASPPSEPSAAESDQGAQPPLNDEIASSPGFDGGRQRWGILEACRRISAIRSVWEARARAVRSRPEPRRDTETSRASRVLDTETIEFIREELQ